MSALAVLSAGLALAFGALAVWTVVQWARWRSATNAFLAIAFTSLAVAIAISRLQTLTPVEIPWWPTVLASLNVVLAAFPWLLAAAVWSLGPRRPWWSWIGIIGVPVVSVWLILAPLSGTPIHPLEELLLLISFGGLWSVAAVATAVHLRRAAGRYVLARSRMRLMAFGMLVINAALLIDLVMAATGSSALQLVMNALALVAALLFLMGFLAPRPLRWWWRVSTMRAFQQMQGELLAALSGQDVAEAVTPRLAELLGSGVIVIDEDGTVLDRAGVDASRAAGIAERLINGARLDGDVRAASVGRGWLVVVTSPYAPLFGQDERDLLDAYASHTRIALERAQLFDDIATEQRDLEAMLLGLAHDLRSPTMTIRGFAELQVDTDDLEERRELAQHIADSTAYLERLVDAMMELGQVRTSAAEREPVELGAVARRVADRIQAARPHTRVEVSGEGTVAMSPVRAEQMLDNLLSNAVKHGGRDDLTITVAVSEEADEHVEVVVADDGVGISEDDRDRIFALFQRGANAGGTGNGLGLGLVRRIAEDLGGRLTLEPTDRGARFVVQLANGARPNGSRPNADRTGVMTETHTA